jgi:anaerobic magnesium-protoporphyrin IX monomethyl ester cyclase
VKKTVLLYAPPPVLDKPSTRAPLALLAVAGPLTKAGFTVRILPRDPAEHETFFSAHKEDALCYGVSVMTGPQIKQALKSSRIAKETIPSMPIVWGGWHPTIFPEQVARHEGIDVAVAGQGEDALFELVTCLSGKMSYKSVEGLVYQAEGRVVNNGVTRLKDINRFPPLNYSLLDMEDYIFEDEIASRTINYVSSRGCPKACPSCAQSMVSGGVWRAYSPSRMIEDALMLKMEYDVEGLLLDDANFFNSEDRARDFAAGLINRAASLKWGRPTGRLEDVLGFDDGFWDIMRISGLTSIFVGLEPRCGAISRTDAGVYGELGEYAAGLASMLAKHGIGLKLSILVGFPPGGSYDWTFETELKGAGELMEACRAAGDTTEATASLYLPFPHAPLYDLAMKAGLTPPATLEEWGEWEPGAKEMPWVPRGASDEVERLNRRYAR